MSHEIDTSNGRANMAWTGQKPWHGLGQELKKGASIGAWKKAAGMNFNVETAPVMFEHDGKIETVENRVVTFRSDTKAPFGVLSDRYKLIQPGEILEFYRDLVKNHDMELETAGVLKGGAVYWALAKTGDEFVVHGSHKDKVGGYVLLATSNDGNMSTKAKFTSVRVVCNNTLTAAGFYSGRKKANEIRIKHTTEFDADRVKADLGLSHGVFNDFSDLVNRMADTGIGERATFNLLADAFYPDRDKSKDKEARLSHVYSTLELVQSSPGADLKSAKGTLWGAINGATFYIDHQRKSADNDKRLRSAWFGPGEVVKNRLWDLALQRIKREPVMVDAS